VAHAVDGQHLVRESKSKGALLSLVTAIRAARIICWRKGAANQPREKKNCRVKARTVCSMSMQISVYGDAALGHVIE
jgi:hypothetical protein